MQRLEYLGLREPLASGVHPREDLEKRVFAISGNHVDRNLVFTDSLGRLVGQSQPLIVEPVRVLAHPSQQRRGVEEEADRNPGLWRLLPQASGVKLAGVQVQMYPEPRIR